MSVRWTKLALGDLKAIRDHISEEDRQAARRVGARLRDAAAKLARHPHLGRPGSVDGTREKLALPYPYIIVYEVSETGGDVVILRLYHMAQDRD